MRRELGLDRGQVAAAVRSEALVRVNGQPAGAGFAPLSRFWRAADGWVRTHANYPWHREALLRVLRCGGEPDAVAAAIARLGAAEVEDRVTGGGRGGGRGPDRGGLAGVAGRAGGGRRAAGRGMPGEPGAGGTGCTASAARRRGARRRDAGPRRGSGCST